MAESRGPDRPIGYWLKKADGLLTARVDEAQRANGLSRLEWQALNVAHQGETTVARVADTLRPFADTATVVEVIERLVQREALAPASAASPAYHLTDQGRRLHAAALEAQTALRQRAMQGIAQDDYETTVRVLQRIVENLQT